MKKIVMIIVLTISMLFSSCTTYRIGDTPLTDDARAKSGLTYHMDYDYDYEIGYPDIFTEEVLTDTGIRLFGDDVAAVVWVEENTDEIELKDKFTAVLEEYEDTSSAGCYKHTFCFNFDNKGLSGFYYSMNYYDKFYSFYMTYPEGDKDKYKEYYQKMEKSFLIFPQDTSGTTEKSTEETTVKEEITNEKD